MLLRHMGLSLIKILQGIESHALIVKLSNGLRDLSLLCLHIVRIITVHLQAVRRKKREMRPEIVIFGDSITEGSFKSGGWGASLANNYSRKADVVLRGYSGYNTRWALFLLHRLFPLGSTTPPVATTIFFGANDAALSGRTSERQHVPTEEYKENLKRIVHHLKKRSFDKECSPAMLVVLITPPPIDEEGRFEQARGTSTPVNARGHKGFASQVLDGTTTMATSRLAKTILYPRSLYGKKAMELPERTNEVTGVYAKQCVELAKELCLPFINLWSKMQETEGWQKKFLSDGLHLTPEGNAVVHQEVVRVFNEAGLSATEMPYDFPDHLEIDGKAPEKAFQQQCL
ncbi:unnamed protein product [Camellia sinensis]